MNRLYLAGCHLSDPICNRAMMHGNNSYYFPNVRITSDRCKTHTVSNTEFSCFGGPQGMLGIDHVIEKLANYLRTDPLNVRRANIYYSPSNLHNGSVTPYDMRVENCIIDSFSVVGT